MDDDNGTICGACMRSDGTHAVDCPVLRYEIGHSAGAAEERARIVAVIEAEIASARQWNAASLQCGEDEIAARYTDKRMMLEALLRKVRQ